MTGVAPRNGGRRASLARDGANELGAVLEAIVERGRALVDARALVILILEGDELAVAATAGELDAAVDGLRFPSADRVRALLQQGDVGRLQREDPAAGALVAPLVFRDTPLGVMVALDRVLGDGAFRRQDARLLNAFAAGAATAVATAQAMAQARLLNRIQAAEHERTRWAQELHDDTLQGLAALRVRLGAALSEGSPDALERAGTDAMEQIDAEIVKLRALITELRPAALDEIGLEAALAALAERSGDWADATVETRLSLNGGRLPSQVLETTVYRLVQEGLANVAKHGHAEHVWLDVKRDEAAVTVMLRDDGVGFDPRREAEGFGLQGMRERARLAGGRLEVVSRPGEGTAIEATLPLAG